MPLANTNQQVLRLLDGKNTGKRIVPVGPELT